MIQKLPGSKYLQAVPAVIGFLAQMILLIVFRELFFQESLLTNVDVVVPLEEERHIVFVVLILISVLSFLFELWTTLGSYRERFSSRIAFANPFRGGIWLFVILLNAGISFCLIELINNYYLLSMESQYVVLGIGITFVIYLVFVLVIGSMSVAMTVGNIFFLIWGFANYYVQSFRGIPLQWIDFASIGTAFSVSGNYDYTPTWQMIGSLIVVISLSGVYLHLRVWHHFKKIPGKIMSRCTGAALALAFFGLIFHTDFLADQGIWLRDWFPWYTYRLFGMESGFLAFAKASFPTAPETYSVDRVNAIIEESKNSTEEPEGVSDNYEIPENIICIMNESFADLSIYPNYQSLGVNTDITPFLHSMEGAENTQQGDLLVSVKGGTTANSEYEFLTGNSMVLSPATVVYNSFIKNDQYSLARILNEQGYTSYALHPFNRTGWNRHMVYPKMGFEEFFALDNFFTGADTLRGFVSDKGDYDALIDLVEQKEDGEKLFLFNVTMQNHSSYNHTPFDDSVTITSYSGQDKDQAQQYLSLIKYSDEALQNLVEYFSESDEKTLLVFFGDHQPEIGDELWQFLQAKEVDDWEFPDQQLGYTTKYFIWANYDLPQLEDQTMSANYLGSYMLSLTGLDSTGYNDYLMDQMETIPAMNAFGYLDQDGIMHEWDSDDVGETEAEMLEKYKCLIYNELTADHNRDETFFGVSDS